MSLRALHDRPQPQPEAEERIRQRLQGLDSLLDIHWFPVAVYVEGKGVEGRYALVCRWPQADPKWQLFYEGKMHEPFDVLAWFCEDLDSADSHAGNIEMMEDQIIEFLGKADQTRLPFAERMKKSVENNLKVRRSAKQEILDMAQDEFEYYRKLIAEEHIIPVNSTPRTTPSVDSSEKHSGLILVKE